MAAAVSRLGPTRGTPSSGCSRSWVSWASVGVAEGVANAHTRGCAECRIAIRGAGLGNSCNSGYLLPTPPLHGIRALLSA